jgi:hypothetical protein
MKKVHNIGLFALVGGLFTGLTVLTSCGPDTSAPDLSVKSQTGQPTIVAVLDSNPSVTETPAELFTDTECLKCHQDQDRLKDLAVEEVVAETLSEGPG